MNIPGYTIDERVTRFKKFFAMENSDRPLIGFYLNSYYPLKRYYAASSLSDGIIGVQDLQVNDYIKNEEELFYQYESFGGDLIYSGSAFWGIPWVESIVGCTPYVDKEIGSMRSIPPKIPLQDITDINNIEYIDQLKFDPGNIWIQKLKEFLIKLKKISSGRFPLGTTLMRGISDCLSALLGSSELVLYIMDYPNVIRKLISILTSTWIEIANTQLDIIPVFKGGVGSYSFNIWMPGRGVWLQEDAMSLLSPSLFEDFFLEPLVKIVKEFDFSIIHLHPGKYLPVELLLDTEINAIEIHLDYKGPRAEDLYHVYRQILKEKPLIIWGDFKIDDIMFIKKKLNREGLFIQPVVGDKEEAEYIWDLFRK